MPQQFEGSKASRVLLGEIETKLDTIMSRLASILSQLDVALSTRASESITGFYVHKGKLYIYVLVQLLRKWCNFLVHSLYQRLATIIHIVYACVRVLMI